MKYQKTRINSIDELKSGDVILIIGSTMLKHARRNNSSLPRCNYRRIYLVSRIHKLANDEKVFDSISYNKLESNDGSDLKILDMLKKTLILTGGSIGCNHRVNEHGIIFKLNTIRNIEFTFKPMTGLKNNPAYDLMM